MIGQTAQEVRTEMQVLRERLVGLKDQKTTLQAEVQTLKAILNPTATIVEPGFPWAIPLGVGAVVLYFIMKKKKETV